jgi:putative transcriptional regulator
MGLYVAGNLNIEVTVLKRDEALQDAEAALHQAGFRVSRRCISRGSCFDFAARDEERLIFAKVLPDIREVSQGVAAAIKTVSRCFSCASVFVSDRNSEDSLRDDTVYSRYGVHVVTLKTLKDIVFRGRFPLVKASRGGYSVGMDGGKIRERRRELGLSVGKLAAMVGVSRRTLYGYERDMTRVSVSTAYELEKILGAPLVETIDIFEASSKDPAASSSTPKGWASAGSRLLQSILSKLTQFGFKVLPTDRAPFDFAAECASEKFAVIGGLFERNERFLRERVSEILSLSGIVGARPLLLCRERMAAMEDVGFVNYDELANMKDREELTVLL